MSKIIFTLLMLSAYAMASGHGAEEASTDIIQRTVNFLIFAGILYYLLAEPLKNYFGGRSQKIADDHNQVKEKLAQSKAEKERAEAKVEEAKKFAANLAENAKKENKIVNDKIMQQCDADLENLAKQSVELMNLEQRKMTSEVVDAIMDDVLSQEGVGFDKEAMAQVIMKKVA